MCCLHLLVETEAENQLVKLADIIAIRPGSGTSMDSQARSHSKFTRSNIELVPVGAATSFSVYHVCRVSGHKLRQSRIVFHTSDAVVVTQWVDRVNDILAWPGCVLVACIAYNIIFIFHICFTFFWVPLLVLIPMVIFLCFNVMPLNSSFIDS